MSIVAAAPASRDAAEFNCREHRGKVVLTSVPAPEAGRRLSQSRVPIRARLLVDRGRIRIRIHEHIERPFARDLHLNDDLVVHKLERNFDGGFCGWAFAAAARLASSASANPAARPKRMADWCINPAATRIDFDFNGGSLHFRLPCDDIVHGRASRGRILLSIAA
jgi:hypothetical protein